MDIGSQNNSVVRFSSVKAGSQGSLSGTVPVSGKQVVRTNPEYEYWLVADTQKESYSGAGSNSSFGLPPILNTGGHAWVGIITRNRITYSDNSVGYSDWQAWKTWGYWGNGGRNGLQNNNEYEMSTINKIIRGEVNGLYSVRKAKNTRSRAEYISNNPTMAGCDPNNYGFNEKMRDSTQCICTVFATRHWNVFTDKLEDFRPWGVFDRAPADVAKKITELNKQGNDFFDSGKIWN